jgi:hypothetical protein
MSENYPPIKPGTRVKTTQQNESMSDDWTLYAQERRKWGVEETVTDHHDSHGLCYDVKHDDGTEGTYDPSEFEVQ